MRVGSLPANGLQAVAQCIPALLVEQALALNRVARAGERGNGRVLLGQEHAKVHLAAELARGSHDVLAPHQKREAGAGHVEGLGEREELHAHVKRAGVVEEAPASRPPAAARRVFW